MAIKTDNELRADPGLSAFVGLLLLCLYVLLLLYVAHSNRPNTVIEQSRNYPAE